MWLSPYLIEF
jgi:hypothetical protein